jgi:hypothetical protein
MVKYRAILIQAMQKTALLTIDTAREPEWDSVLKKPIAVAL